MADNDSSGTDKRRQEPPPIEFVRPGEEPPAAPPPEKPAAWVTRPEDYMRPRYPEGPAPPRSTAPGEGRIPRVAGIVLVLAGATSIAWLLGVSLTPMSTADYANISSNPSVYALNQICGAIVTWAQAIALLAGVMAFQRMSWRLTVACAFFAMFTLGGFAVLVLDPYAAVSGFLGVAGFLLAFIGRREFLS